MEIQLDYGNIRGYIYKGIDEVADVQHFPHYNTPHCIGYRICQYVP